VMCELLGVPYDDRDHFQQSVSVTVNLNNSLEDRGKALREVQMYLGELVARKDAEPADDLLSRVIKKYQDAGTYDHKHVTGLASLLLGGGFETTANMISLGIVALLENPGQRDMLLADPELAPRAVEEMLRFFSVSDHATSRVVLEDIEIGGVRIPAGDGVIAVNAAANRDGSVFADPDTLNINRDDARHHMAFGY